MFIIPTNADCTPFTIVLKELTVLDIVFVVGAGMSDANELVDMTPFTFVLIIPVEVEKLITLFDITLVVATMPFMLLVSVLPITD